jgi:hypothetical protein
LAKPARRKLKVFQAQLGFYDTVVGAPSQAAALRAWGVHQNLFASRQASLTDDEAAIKAALAHPETPLKRAAGSKDPFDLQARLPDVPDAPKRKAAPKRPAKAPRAPHSAPPADRGQLDAAEAALHRLDEARKHEETYLQRRQEELDQVRSAAQTAYVEARKAATTKVVAAREAYRDAGGRD